MNEKSLVIEKYVIITLFSLIIIVMFSEVIARYVLSVSLPWAQQLARIGFVWITFAGISMAAAKGMHLKVSAITLIVPAGLHQIIYIIGNSIGAIFGFFMGYQIFISMMDIFSRGQTFPVLWGMPTWVMYLPGSIGMFGFGLRLIFFEIIPAIRDEINKRKTTTN